LAPNSNNRFDFAFRLVLCLLICLAFSPCTTYGASFDGWLLTQRHKQLGQNYVYLTHDALKIVNKTLGFVILLAVLHTYYQIDNPLLPFRKVNHFGTNKSDHLNLWLSVSINEGYQGKITFLDTVEAKKMKFDAKEFAYPVGFKKLANAGQAFVSKKGTNGLGDIIKDLDLGEDLGKQEAGKHETDVKKPAADKKSDTGNK